MAIYVGNQKIKDIYLGNQKIKEVYKGEQLVYTAVVDPRSYWVSTGGVKSYFDYENTPIANFQNSGPNTSSITINGVAVVKNTVKELNFGDSYNFVGNVSNYFIYAFTYLEKINFRGLLGLSTIGAVFFSTNYVLTTLDLSPLVSITSFGNQPFNNLYSLTEIKIGSKDYSGVTAPANGFGSCPNNSSCIIYASTLELANIFKAKFPNLSNWSVAVG